MYKYFFLLTITICISVTPAYALRCGSDLIEVGDLKIEVKLACGEPLSTEVIGYIDQVRYKADQSYSEAKSSTGRNESEERVRVMIIEEWIIKESDNYYSLVFEGNKLKEIEWVKR